MKSIQFDGESIRGTHPSAMASASVMSCSLATNRRVCVLRWLSIAPAFGARIDYRARWDAINGKRATWASNPLVWVIDFKVIEWRRLGLERGQ